MPEYDAERGQWYTYSDFHAKVNGYSRRLYMESKVDSWGPDRPGSKYTDRFYDAKAGHYNYLECSPEDSRTMGLPVSVYFRDDRNADWKGGEEKKGGLGIGEWRNKGYEMSTVTTINGMSYVNMGLPYATADVSLQEDMSSGT